MEHYSNASYKSFRDRRMAEMAFEKGEVFALGLTPYRNAGKILLALDPPVSPSICVDAACNCFTGEVEFRGIIFPDRRELFSYGPFEKGCNNLGEFLAIVTALQYAADHGLTPPIYSDSRIALLWVKQKNIRTGVVREVNNEPLFALVVAFLHASSHTLYLFHLHTYQEAFFPRSAVNWYISAGPGLTFWDVDPVLAIGPLAGLDIRLFRTPVRVFVDWRLRLSVTDGTGAWENVRFGLGVRYDW